MVVRITLGLLVYLCLTALEVVKVVNTVFAPVDVIYRPEQERVTVIGERAWRYSGKAMADKEHIQAALSAAYKQVNNLLWQNIAEIYLAIIEHNDPAIEHADPG